MNNYYEVFTPKNSGKKRQIYQKLYKKEHIIVERKTKIDKNFTEYYSSVLFNDNNFWRLNIESACNIIIKEIKFCLRKICSAPKILNKFFVVGLGNSDIVADRLGTIVCKKIITTCDNIKNSLIDREIFASVFSLAPSITQNNGISTASIIKTITDEFKPDLVVVIDSMCCKNLKYLFNTIQISTSGLTPGSVFKTKQEKLDSKFLGVPVISVGCPFVFNLKTLKNSFNNTILTSINIKEITKKYANLIAYSLNRFFHNKLTKQEIKFLSFDNLV